MSPFNNSADDLFVALGTRLVSSSPNALFPVSEISEFLSVTFVPSSASTPVSPFTVPVIFEALPVTVSVSRITEESAPGAVVLFPIIPVPLKIEISP